MTLWAYRDTKAERLVGRLAATLADNWPADPMAPVTVVIGSRGMQRWLNHELATLQGSVAAVDFLFPGKAFGRAIDAIHAAAGVPAPVDDGAWTGTALHRRVIRAVRARLSDPAFERVHRYLGACDGPVSARELAFTRGIAEVLARLLYDRPDDAAAWMADPAAAPDEHRWLAQLLADLKETTTTLDPPARLARLRGLPTQRIDAPLFVFGLSSLRNGDKVHLAELARHMDIHLFMLVPSTEWWADIRLRSHERAALRTAKTPAETKVRKNSARFTEPMVWRGSWPVPTRVVVTTGPQPPPPTASRKPPNRPSLATWRGSPRCGRSLRKILLITYRPISNR